jgi:hypothetical protein
MKASFLLILFLLVSSCKSENNITPHTILKMKL